MNEKRGKKETEDVDVCEVNESLLSISFLSFLSANFSRWQSNCSAVCVASLTVTASRMVWLSLRKNSNKNSVRERRKKVQERKRISAWHSRTVLCVCVCAFICCPLFLLLLSVNGCCWLCEGICRQAVLCACVLMPARQICQEKDRGRERERKNAQVQLCVHEPANKKEGFQSPESSKKKPGTARRKNRASKSNLSSIVEF